MINLDQSIAKMKEEVNSLLSQTRAEGGPPEPASKPKREPVYRPSPPLSEEERRAHEIMSHAETPSDLFLVTIKKPQPPGARLTPIYRPEFRGSVWCIFDTANVELRKETFECKGDARAFITRLERGEEIDEPYYHERAA